MTLLILGVIVTGAALAFVLRPVIQGARTANRRPAVDASDLAGMGGADEKRDRVDVAGQPHSALVQARSVVEPVGAGWGMPAGGSRTAPAPTTLPPA